MKYLINAVLALVVFLILNSLITVDTEWPLRVATLISALTSFGNGLMYIIDKE